MDETLASLMIVLKTVGLNESKTGLKDLSAVLSATGMSAEGLAAAIKKSGTAMEHVNDITRAHAIANRDAEMFTSRYATSQEKVLGLLERLGNARQHISSTELYNRALADMNAQLAQAEGRFVSLVSLQKSAATFAAEFGARSLQGASDGDARGFVGPNVHHSRRLQGASDGDAKGFVGPQPIQPEYGPGSPTAAQLANDVRTRAAEAAREQAEAERQLNAARAAGSAVARQYMTDEERVQERVREAKNLYRSGTLGVDDYRRAMSSLSGELAQAQGRFVSLESVERSATALSNRQREHRNMLQMQATNLLRQLESPQDAHNRRLGHYNTLLEEGLINQREFNTAVAQSEKAMRQQSALGSKGGGLASMQIGYAMQDFATVAAMGGEGAMARGFMAASNNLGQMVVVAGVLSPMMAAITATAVTLAAVLGPKIWDYFISGAETSEEIMKRIVEEAMNLNKQLEQQVRLRSGLVNSNEGKSSGQIGGDLVGLSREADIERDAVNERKRQQRLIYTQIRMEANTGAGQFGSAADVLRAGNATSGQIASAMPLDFLTKNNTTAGQVKGLGAEVMVAYQRGVNALIAKDERMLEAKEGERQATEKLAENKLKSIQAEQDLIDAINREAKERQRQYEAMQQQQRASQAASAIDARRGFQERFEINPSGGYSVKPESSSYQKAFTDDIARIRAARGSGTISGAQAGDAVVTAGMDAVKSIDADIAALEKQNQSRFQPSMSGVSEFGKQFQMALMKPEDEAKKQREAQIKELQQIRQGINAMAGKELTAGVGA